MRHRDASTPTGDFANAVLEFLSRLRRDLNRPFDAREREPEVLELGAGNDAALGRIDHQTQFFGEIPRDRFHDPLGGTFGLREDRKIVCIPHKRQTTLLQFLVQIIQQDVGKKR